MLIIDKEKFIKNNVWVTEKIRMEANERRIRLKKQLFVFLNLTTLLVVILSLLDMYVPKGKKIASFALLSLIFSIIVLSMSLIITNLNLESEAQNYRESYLELQNIYFHSEDMEFSKIKDAYMNILNKYENHNNLDFIYFKVTQERNCNKTYHCNFREKISYFLTKYLLDIVNIVIVLSILVFVIFYGFFG